MRRLITYAAVFQLAACARTVPPPVVPRWDALSGTTITIEDDEKKLWDQATRRRGKLAQDKLLVNDAVLTVYLESVLTNLLVAPLPPEAPKPTVFVIRSPERRAGAAADGAILVSTSALAAIENEAQLAAVLGHEIAHVVARHALVAARYAKTSRSLAERMELSREHESYCDRYALERMLAAGYDVRELPRMLELLASDADKGTTWSGDSPFRTHPFTDERIRALRPATAEAPTGNGRVDTDRYEHGIVSVLPVAAEVELEAKLLDQAKASIERLLRIRPDSGRGYYLVAEHARLTQSEGRRSPAARQAYERAVELAPDDPDAVRALGLLYRDDGDLHRSTPLLERYLNLVPDSPDRKLIERYLQRSSL